MVDIRQVAHWAVARYWNPEDHPDAVQDVATALLEAESAINKARKPLPYAKAIACHVMFQILNDDREQQTRGTFSDHRIADVGSDNRAVRPDAPGDLVLSDRIPLRVCGALQAHNA